ncbi:hypothetical protein, partial [Salmonella sp. s51228]|uniref:hypothetical protein n=1 Tax=Salmonella sp. s51228 TaxID=3159652 RepID=UPI0039814DA7
MNGTSITTLTPSEGQNSYTTGTQSLLEYFAEYTVIAISCAGSTLSSPAVFAPLTFAPPSAANITISSTPVPPTSCTTGNITLTWTAVTSEFSVTSYEVLMNGTRIATLTPIEGQNSYTTGTQNLLEYYAEYTVTAISCAGSTLSSPAEFTPLTFAPPSAATITISSTFV